MTKFGLFILEAMIENGINNSIKAVSVSQLMEIMSSAKRKSYSTTFRHLQQLTEQGYLKCGFVDGLAITYYISDNGKMICKDMN